MRRPNHNFSKPAGSTDRYTVYRHLGHISRRRCCHLWDKLRMMSKRGWEQSDLIISKLVMARNTAYSHWLYLRALDRHSVCCYTRWSVSLNLQPPVSAVNWFLLWPVMVHTAERRGTAHFQTELQLMRSHSSFCSAAKIWIWRRLLCSQSSQRNDWQGLSTSAGKPQQFHHRCCLKQSSWAIRCQDEQTHTRNKNVEGVKSQSSARPS